MLQSGHEILFPPISEADESGLLALGGDLSPNSLITAYKNGIFPWYNEGEPIMWWSPDPRCVIFPDELIVSKSMKQLIAKHVFEFSINQAFTEVMKGCRDACRKEGPGTWIHDDMIHAYTTLHQLGYAISAEAWTNGKLAGGLYGVLIGKVFYGESMFHRESNASKFAFIRLLQQLKEEGLELVDCQMETAHLKSMGARMISRNEFAGLLSKLI